MKEEEEEASASEESSSDDESYKRSSKKSASAQKYKGSRGRAVNSSRSAVDYTEKGSDEDVGVSFLDFRYNVCHV